MQYMQYNNYIISLSLIMLYLRTLKLLLEIESSNFISRSDPRYGIVINL